MKGSRPKTRPWKADDFLRSTGMDCQRLNHELTALFGRDLVERAQQIDLTTVTKTEAESVKIIAQQLQRMSGRPTSQAALLAAIPESSQSLLCRWLLDPGTATGIVRQPKPEMGSTEGQSRRVLSVVPTKASCTKPNGLVRGEGETMEVLTVKETAEILRVKPRTIRAAIERGELKARKLGRDWRLLNEDLGAFMRNDSGD